MDSRLSILEKEHTKLEDAYSELLLDAAENLRIDIYNLESDCSTHANHFLDVALFASDAGLLVNKSELLVKELKAEIATDVRSKPEDYGIVKLTEGQVMEAVDSADYAKEVRSLRAECWSLKNNADALVQAFEHRRSMLNNEVSLYLSKLSEPQAGAKRKDIEKTIGERKRVRRLKK